MIKGITLGDTDELDFVLVDVDISQYNKKRYKEDYLGHKGYLMEAAKQLAKLKIVKAIESVYEPVYGERITPEEKAAHIQHVEGNFMEDLRDQFWDNQPEEVRKYYERLAEQEIE